MRKSEGSLIQSFFYEAHIQRLQDLETCQLNMGARVEHWHFCNEGKHEKLRISYWRSDSQFALNPIFGCELAVCRYEGSPNKPSLSQD